MKNNLLKIALFITLFFTAGNVYAQETGTIVGNVTDADTGEELIGVNVFIRGTNFGSATDLDGNFRIRNIRPGEYNVEVSYIGYDRTLLSGIRVTAGEETNLEIALNPQVLSTDQDIVVVGDRPIFDIEQSSSSSNISRDQIQAAASRRIDEVVGMQAGVFQDPTGLYIRGGRANETGFVVDGVSAQDPLSGTGFGLDLGANAYANVEVTTGGVGVEHGDVTSGVVSVRTQEGGENYTGYFSHKRDNPGRMTGFQSNFFTDVYEANFGGPAPIYTHVLPALGIELPGTLRFFFSGQAFTTNEFMKNTADQVRSSIIEDEFWSPRQDNRWSGMLRLTYRPRSTMRVDAAYQRSLTVNQNTRMLQVVGDDVQIRPGYQFFFAENLDNANTYAHDSNMSYIKWTHTIDSNTFYDVQVSRLFTRLRADANGRFWRPAEVDGEFDASSIVTPPITEFQTGRDFMYVLPGSGFSNNGGIASLWHDHYAEEYTSRINFTRFFLDQTNRLTIGLENKFMDYQWIDITRPWVGAPIQIGPGEFTETQRLGSSSDIWNVKPRRGALYVNDQIRYQGLIANIGMRLEYWAPGRYVDDNVQDPRSPVPDEIKEAYLDETMKFLDGTRFKMRMLPRISVSFPVRENQVMFFNYGHKSKLPHPTHVYAGLDPFYQDRSFLSNLGNPNLNPEVDISYEIGLRNQLTSNDALNVSVFWSDKYDFITSERIVIIDPSGRESERAFRVNGDFARVRGVEMTYIKRYQDWFQGQLTATYSRAEGLSSTSNDALQNIIVGGQAIGNNIETPLAWDRPWDIKANATFTYDRSEPLFGLTPLNQMKVFISGMYRSGQRYTPMQFLGNETNPVTGEQNWRPIYERDPDPSARFSESGTPWVSFDLNFQKWFMIGDTRIVTFLEISNLFNNQNAAIINPVTGKAYKSDYPTNPDELVALRDDRSYDVPANVRDPRYIDPRDNNSPSYLNPANFLEQRHIMFGVAFNF